MVIAWSQFSAERSSAASGGASVLSVNELEANKRLSSMLDVLEREKCALQALDDPRLEQTLHALTRLSAEIVAALAALTPSASVN
jgi:hypothetical protein